MRTKVIEVKKVFPMFDNLVSREAGFFLRFILERELAKNDIVILDFKDISLITQGFGDELIGVLVRRKGLDFVKNKIKVQNARDCIRTTLNWVVSYSKSKVA